MAHTDELCEQAIESFKLGWSGAAPRDEFIEIMGQYKDLDQLPLKLSLCCGKFSNSK